MDLIYILYTSLQFMDGNPAYIALIPTARAQKISDMHEDLSNFVSDMQMGLSNFLLNGIVLSIYLITFPIAVALGIGIILMFVARIQEILDNPEIPDSGMDSEVPLMEEGGKKSGEREAGAPGGGEQGGLPTWALLAIIFSAVIIAILVINFAIRPLKRDYW
jgi:hypothetical protein